MTTTVDRHDPRNSRIISAVSAAAIAPSRYTALRTLPSTTYWTPSSLATLCALIGFPW